MIVKQAEAITSPLSAMPIFTLGGAVARVDDDATAFTGRSAAHDINIVASWLPDDPEPERHKAWARATWEALQPFSNGVYVNFMCDEPASHMQLAYGGRKYAWLAALKSKYDPDNVFRFNQKHLAYARELTNGPEWDVVVVGGGAAGCVLANRLSETDSSVLLLAAG